MANKIVNILLLGGAKRLSLAERLMESGKKKGMIVRLFSYELDRHVPIIAYAKIIVGLKWKDENILEHLTGVIIQNSIHIVIPNVDPAIGIAAKLKFSLPGVFIPVSDPDVCERYFDKIDSDRWFVSHKIPVPEQDNRLPLIAKPRKGSASQGIIKINTEQELAAFRSKTNAEDYLVQRFIDGEEWTVDAYISGRNGTLAVVPRKRLGVVGGEVVKAVTVRDQVIIKLAEAIIDKMGAIGPINIQFIRETNSGNLYVMEVNPRLGGGVILSIEAGANITDMIFNDFLGLRNKKAENWKENLIMLRANREVFVNAADN